MYNKLFSKIVDSSIWLETIETRLVWLTMIAVMDEDGFVAMASTANLARRANIDAKKCATAVTVLESPDLESSDPDYEGRRIERVPGGWIVLNAPKYRDLVTKVVQREQTRLRVQKHRDKVKATVGNGGLTPSGGITPHSDQVTHGNVPPLNVTPSEADTEAETRSRSRSRSEAEEHVPIAPRRSLQADAMRGRFAQFWEHYPRKVGRGAAWRVWERLRPDQALVELMLTALAWQRQQPQWLKDSGQFVPNPATWLNQSRWLDEAQETPQLGEKTVRTMGAIYGR